MVSRNPERNLIMCNKKNSHGSAAAELAGNVLGGIALAAPVALIAEWQAHAEEREREHEERMSWYEALPDPTPGEPLPPSPTPPWML